MPNVIREDIVKLSFDIGNSLKDIQKLQKDVVELKKAVTGGVGDEAFDDLRKSANETVKPLKKVKEQAEKVTKSLKEMGKKAATTAFNGLKKIAGISFKGLMVGIGAAAAAIGGLVAKSVSAVADFEQLKGGVETLFGAKGAKSVDEYAKSVGKSVKEVQGEYDKMLKAQDTVLTNANNAYKTTGLSANAYMETVTSFSASLISSLKGDTEKAATYADTALINMSDNANKMGTDMGMLQNAYQGFAKQNYTMLDNLKLGYGGTKTEMERLIKDAAKMKDVQKKLGVTVDANSMSFGNIVQAINVMQESMSINGTTSKEAATTITGSLNATKAAWGNLLTAMGSGENLDQCIDNMVDSVETFGNNVIPVAEKALGGIGKVIERLAPIISEKLPPLAEKLLPPLIKAAVELTKGLIKALPNIIKTVAVAIVDIFGEQFPIVAKIGNFFKDNAGKIANSLKTLIPIVIALAAAFKGFKAIKSITSIFGGDKGGAGKKGGGVGGITNFLKDLAKAKPTTILKGMANLGIILGGFAALTTILLLVAPLITKIGGFKELLKLSATMLVLGAVGAALAKFGEIAGKIQVGTVVKGLANMAIILGGMSVLLLLVSAISLIKFDLKRVLGIALIIGVLGTIGAALVLFAGICGIIPVAVVALGLANMAIMLAGMSALLLLLGAVSLIKFDLKRIVKIAGVITVIGVIGTALALLGAICGIIPVYIVALGLANMAIMIAGVSALLLLLNEVAKLNLNLGRILKIAGVITVIGAVGSALAIFGGIAGIIPFPVVLQGLTNMGLVLGGITALIVAFGALSEIKGFTEFLDKGGETLSKVFSIIGDCAGSLIGSLGESISKSLPAIGENIGEFGKNVTPLFDAIKGVDMGGVGSFFTALVGLLGIATGKDIIDGIKSFFGGGDKESPLAKLGTELSDFATNAKGFFTTIDTFPDGSFSKAAELFKSLSVIKDLPKADKKGATPLSAIATDLSTFSDKTSGFFTSVENINTEKVTALWESLKSADSIATDSLANANKEVTKLIELAADLPVKMGDGIKEASSSLSTAIVEMWKDAVEASVKPVNKLLSGANHILKEFGSNKRVVEWQPYAKGTDGHKGGNALVNDGRGAELVQMPNGRTFIPQGRNVFIPNAPKGMKVLSAEKTAKLMGKKSATFKYAQGIGNIDIWDYIDNASGLIGKITEGIKYSGEGVGTHIAKGMVSTISSQMTAWADKLFEEMGALTLASYNPSKGVEQWKSTVIRALKMEKQYSALNLRKTLYQMQTESGGNPRAINLWDSNAKKGIPSKGLMQVIDPTFNAYARAGFDKNIYDPLSNILASIRYAVSRYGSLSKAYRGVGYANGTGTIRVTSYSPESDSGTRPTNTTEHNTYSPQFNFTISGTSDDRTMYRKIKRMIAEAWNEMLDDLEAKTPQTQQV